MKSAQKKFNQFRTRIEMINGSRKVNKVKKTVK